MIVMRMIALFVVLGVTGCAGDRLANLGAHHQLRGDRD
jgi:hypothetical protein